MDMKVRILKSTKKQSWYADHIGDEFEVRNNYKRDRQYGVEIGQPHPNLFKQSGFLVNYDDCEVVL